MHQLGMHDPVIAGGGGGEVGEFCKLGGGHSIRCRRGSFVRRAGAQTQRIARCVVVRPVISEPSDEGDAALVEGDVLVGEGGIYVRAVVSERLVWRVCASSESSERE